jgi:hypothetical protein
MGNNFNINKYKKWLTSEDPYQRAIGLDVIWHTNTRSEEIDKAIIYILRSDDHIDIRRDAIRFLSSTADVKFKDVFIECLEDEDWCVKGEALLGLKKIDPNWKDNKQVIAVIENDLHPYVQWCIEEE